MPRIERDLVGKRELDDNTYYGIQTLRASENFRITGEKSCNFTELIIAFAKIKKTCCLANLELGKLDKKIAEAICQAIDLIIAGKYHDQFIVDPIQGGAGTSMNMNVNEVITNIALEVLQEKKGSYHIVSPNDHVNLSQSTNDTYPSSVKVAIYFAFDKLIEEMDLLSKSFAKKAKEFKDIFKVGRTQLQDAVPMTLGQTFNAYKNQIEISLSNLKEGRKYLLGLNIGATAIGTGIASHKDYVKTAEKHIKQVIGEDFYIVEDLFTGTQDASSFSLVSGYLKKFAIQLSKISNDLRLLSSGPKAGLGEIILPAKQAGSSIMPGKVNPVIAEVVNQTCFQIIGFDTAISFAAEGGQLELNAFEPLIAYNLLKGISMMTNSLNTLRINCVDDIIANKEHCNKLASENISIVTNLIPVIGYKESTKIARIALLENKSVYSVVLEKGLIEEEELKKLLDITTMTKP